MCMKQSGIAVLSGETVRVFMSEETDSHTEIREEFNIRDDGGPGATRQTPIELIPVTSLTDLDGMRFVFDDERPDWWTDRMTEDATRQLYQHLMSFWNEDRTAFTFKGDLYLPSLTGLPEGVSLSAGGHLDLPDLTSIPEGVTISAGGNLNLWSLTSIPEGVTLSAGGYLNLWSLTSIPEGVSVKAEQVQLQSDCPFQSRIVENLTT